MNKATFDRIVQGAKFLSTPTAIAARGNLATPLELALKVIDCLADGKPHHVDEIAKAIAIHPETVRQVLRALDQGGYGLTFAPMSGWSAPPQGGRSPLTVQAKKTVQR